MHVEFRAYSWDMLMTCSFPVHRVDPANYVAYVHVMGIARAVQESQKVQRAWQTIYDQITACSGLCATYKTYMKRLHIDDQGEPFTWILGEERIDIRSMPRKKTGHKLRQHMRQQALERAAQRRTHLAGAKGACTDTLRRCVDKHTGTIRAEILMIICDGVWTQSKKAQASLVESDRCVWCGDREDLAHIFYQCPKWHTQRDAFRQDIPMLSQGPSCRKLCLVPDVDTTSAQRKRWPQLVEAVAHLLACPGQSPAKTQKSPSNQPAHFDEEMRMPTKGSQYFQFSYREGLRNLALYS